MAYYDIPNRRIRRYIFRPTEEDVREVLDHLERRMNIYELEHFIRDLNLEDVVKALLIRGHPVAYVYREVQEMSQEKYEGFISRRPVNNTTRYIREVKIFSGGYEQE